MIAIESHPQGAILAVRAQPGARSAGLRGEQHGALKVAVTQVAEKGKANEAVVALLAEKLGLRKSQIELLAGPTSPQKKFLIHDLTTTELSARIDKALAAEQDAGTAKRKK